jgi:phosphopantetheine--protein transferase-like protein
MEDKIKKIIAVFLQKEPSEINSATLINSTAIPGSIMIHMMYRQLTLAGFPLKKYIDINTYGDLINRINGVQLEQTTQPAQVSTPVIQTSPITVPINQSNSDLEIGIDIENISNFPAVKDYREDPFYKTNFTQSEISYCILKPSPLESFAGLFCLKEAICKTNENFRKIQFNQIEISHSPEGKPEFKGYALSVSHTKDVATGIAIIKGGNKEEAVIQPQTEIEQIIPQDSTESPGSRTPLLLSVIALLLAITAIIMEIYYK